MKELLLNNWKPKIGSLLVATALWYLVKGHLEREPKGRNNQGAVPARTDQSAHDSRAANRLIVSISGFTSTSLPIVSA